MATPGFQSARPAGWCSQCGAQLSELSKFCSACGAPVIPRLSMQQSYLAPGSPPRSTTPATTPTNAHQAVAHGFGSVFGLHPGIASFTIAVNLMLFGTDGAATVSAILTGGADVVVALPAVLTISGLAGAAVGVITYMGQKKWYGDDAESAKIKGLITGVLTAIPTGLPGMLFGGVAVLGALFRRKKN
jgi:hypothetical protein